MFYTPPNNNNYFANERGYMYELDNVTTKVKERSNSF